MHSSLTAFWAMTDGVNSILVIHIHETSTRSNMPVWMSKGCVLTKDNQEVCLLSDEEFMPVIILPSSSRTWLLLWTCLLVSSRLLFWNYYIWASRACCVKIKLYFIWWAFLYCVCWFTGPNKISQGHCTTADALKDRIHTSWSIHKC